MSVTLTINGQHDRASADDAATSLFDYAEQLGVQRAHVLPQERQVQGVHRRGDRGHGSALAAAPTPKQHLKGNFRLSCQYTHRRRRRRRQLPHDAPRPDAHRTARVRPARRATEAARSTRPSRATAIASCSTARRSTARTGPIHGIAMDLGTTTIVLRLLNLETGELVADASFENPQRFGGSDVMSRIHYDTEHPRQAADAHARRLSHARHRGVSRRSANDLRNGRRRQLDDARSCSSGRASIRSARIRISRSPKSKWPRASATTTSLDDTGQRSLLPIHPQGARLRRADHQRPRRRRCRRVHARGRSRATKSGSSPSWTSARTPS